MFAQFHIVYTVHRLQQAFYNNNLFCQQEVALAYGVMS